MQVVSIISTKGGVGKTTTAANLGGLAADAGLRVLLLDLDVQPTLSSYYELTQRAPGGIYELLAFNERDLGQLVSRTIIAGLDLVLSGRPPGRAEHVVAACAGWPPAVAASAASTCSPLRPGADRHPGRAFRAAGDGGARLRSPRCRPSRRRSSRHASCGAAPCSCSKTLRRTGTWASNRRRCTCFINRGPPGVRQRTADPAGLARPVPGQRRHPRARHRRAGHRSVSTCRNARPAGASGRAPPAARQSRPCRARHDARARQRVVPAMAGPTGSSIRPPAATS